MAFFGKYAAVKSNHEKLAALEHFMQSVEVEEYQVRLRKGIADIHRILNLISSNFNVELDVSLARGLSYYTGTVMEVVVNDEKVPSDFKIGSIGSGGRYDK